MRQSRITLRALVVGLLISAVILGGLRVASAQSIGPPSTSQIAEMTLDQPPAAPATVQPAAVTLAQAAAILAAELLLVPEEFLVNLPLVTR